MHDLISNPQGDFQLVEIAAYPIKQEQVLANKDLDLPTQQELLAQFRCDEIASVAFGEFEAQIVPLRKPVEAGTVNETLGSSMKESRSSAMSKFDVAASRYHPAVYQRKRAELLAKMNASLSPLFIGQLTNLHKAIVKEYRTSIAAALKTEGYNFGQLVREADRKAQAHFVKQASRESVHELSRPRVS